MSLHYSPLFTATYRAADVHYYTRLYLSIQQTCKITRQVKSIISTSTLHIIHAVYRSPRVQHCTWLQTDVRYYEYLTKIPPHNTRLILDPQNTRHTTPVPVVAQQHVTIKHQTIYITHIPVNTYRSQVTRLSFNF